jgi:FixJ family two-component response regulator
MEAFQNSRVMVLDDDGQICDSVTATIQSWGLCAEGFTRHETALENVRRNKCDIILLDVFVSDVCGLDLIPQFGDDLKIIIITGFADKDIAIRALKLGAFDLLEKPFHNELLYHCILRALRTLENERMSRRLTEEFERSRSELVAQQERLENLKFRLLDTNRAVSVFAQNIEREREEIEKRTAQKLRDLILPVVAGLINDQAFHKYEAQLHLLAMQIEDLTSGFAIDSSLAATLSTTEIRIASLIKNGIRTEDIATRLHISENTVRTHRKNIRRKLKINLQYSLRNFLNSRTVHRRQFQSAQPAYIGFAPLRKEYPETLSL